METLEILTPKHIQTIQAIDAEEKPTHGAPLTAIASHLAVSPPTALEHLSHLENLGLIVRYRGKTRLTPEGQSALTEYERHHLIAEELFNKVGLSPDDVREAAHEVDLALSHETVERLCEALGHPERCPHGEPIPPCQQGSKAHEKG